MRTLPESASLDHLRRQAKDLLATLRGSDPSMTLADAQASLARQYGYDTWPELKLAADEKRATPPVVADDAVVTDLVDRFGLGSASSPMVRVARNWAAQVWELETAAGRVVFSELAEYVKPEDIEIEAGLVERAIEVGVLAPAPMRTSDGRVVTSVAGSNWRAHRWVKLGPVPARPAAPGVAAAAGRVLSQLHSLAMPAPQPVVAWLTCRPSEQEWRALLDQCRRDRPEWAEQLSRAVLGFLALDAVVDEVDPNPKARLSHACLQPDAVHLAGPDAIVVCGWEHASAIPPDWELGACVMAWAETDDGRLVRTPAAAFLNAYRESGGSPVELETSMFTTGVTGLINWTASRVNIALNSDDSDERDLAARTVPGLLANPISVETLERLVESLQ